MYRPEHKGLISCLDQRIILKANYFFRDCIHFFIDYGQTLNDCPPIIFYLYLPISISLSLSFGGTQKACVRAEGAYKFILLSRFFFSRIVSSSESFIIVTIVFILQFSVFITSVQIKYQPHRLKQPKHQPSKLN